MALRTFCLCFTATSDDTSGGGAVLTHSTCGAEVLTTPLGIATDQKANLTASQLTSSYAIDTSNISSDLPSKQGSRKLRNPSSASGCNPSVAPDPSSQRKISNVQLTSGIHNPNQKLSVELTKKLADECSGRISGITFPAAASVPVSFEQQDPELRTLKVEPTNDGPNDAGVTVRALSQLGGGDLCGASCGSGSPPSTTFPKSQPDFNLPARSLSRPLPLHPRIQAAADGSSSSGGGAGGSGGGGDLLFVPAANELVALPGRRGLAVVGGATAVSSFARVISNTRIMSRKGSAALKESEEPPGGMAALETAAAAVAAAPPPLQAAAATVAAPHSIFSTNAALACRGGDIGASAGQAAAVVPMSTSVHGGIEVADLPCNRFAVSAVAEGQPAAATAAAAAPSLVRDAASLVPAHSSASTAGPNNSRTTLPYLASRHMSQVAFLHMLQDGGDSDRGTSTSGPADGTVAADNSSPSLSQLPLLGPPCLQLQQFCTLDLAALSREISGLRWIGQGGGGAVFQGMWQGAPVAVKFLLGESQGEPGTGPGHCGGGEGGVNVLALEGVVSSVVNHPNVVHTFAFQCARLTEASLAPEPEVGQLDGGPLDEHGTRDLFESLLDTAGSYGNTEGSGAVMRRGLHHLTAIATVGGSGSSGFGAAASAATGAASHLGWAGVGARASMGHQVSRFGSIVQEAGGGGSGVAVAMAAAAGAPCLPEVKLGGGGDVVELEGQRVHQREGRDGDIVKREEYGGAGEGAGESRRRVPDMTAVEGRLRTKAVTRSAVQVQQQQQREVALESTFQSDEGFGDPEFGSSRGWTVRQALQHLKARPGMYLTYIIMEYCDRGSLLAAIRRGIFRIQTDQPQTHGTPAAAIATSPVALYGNVSPQGGPWSRFPRRIVLRAILRTARDIAQGMCHLHANGIIHGDLKPGNVLLRGCRSDRRGFVAMVADFGLSKVTRDDKPLEAHHWSTVTVMAPEVIMGRWLKASDVFSYGILLWQLVTSEPVPYSKLTVPQILMGVAQGKLKPEWPASAHPPLVRLGRACLATSPEKRPSFEAIVKVLIKIEKRVRDELRVARSKASAPAGADPAPRYSISATAAPPLPSPR
ncbi:hypothetical protein VaNZ11_016661 [Volvox africanus]|uniref:Protein kinase domain-containing protein n=1 Tax=Volvox africanus TaxID=51714 RepID=A0ABQ5SP98_9CHLO|nr:hypothetical protein VaNZ11_016661 [Volvox africanus]